MRICVLSFSRQNKTADDSAVYVLYGREAGEHMDTVSLCKEVTVPSTTGAKSEGGQGTGENGTLALCH
jgi:hypothetical protein